MLSTDTAAHPYCMPCNQANFAQCLDVQRPHTLITDGPNRSGTLEYRYDDTAETVVVPNIWYNQTWQVRAAAARYEASAIDERAHRYEQLPPGGVSPREAADIARRLRIRADRLRADAARMVAERDDARPVLVSRTFSASAQEES